MIVAAALGFVALNLIIAYVPVMLVVGYNVHKLENPQPTAPPTLRDRYVEGDELSTAEYLARVDDEWRDVKHSPLI